MFGYVVCNKNGLSEEETARYQSIYCGLCMSLKKRFGQLGRLSLNYDMTFLALFLSSLYEPEESKVSFRCMVHPLHSKEMIISKYSDYAADMTIALTYHKCLDDWEDDHNHVMKKYASLLKKHYRKVLEKYPRQCSCIEQSIRELSRIEKDRTAMADEAVNWSGRMLSELFVYEEDFWSNSLRSFGYHLGRFIYLMDAAVDYKKDEKSGSYNPLFRMHKKPEEIEEILRSAIGSAMEVADRMPLLQDEHLLQNILYCGVWQVYDSKVIGKGEKDGQ